MAIWVSALIWSTPEAAVRFVVETRDRRLPVCPELVRALGHRLKGPAKRAACAGDTE